MCVNEVDMHCPSTRGITWALATAFASKASAGSFTGAVMLCQAMSHKPNDTWRICW